MKKIKSLLPFQIKKIGSSSKTQTALLKEELGQNSYQTSYVQGTCLRMILD